MHGCSVAAGYNLRSEDLCVSGLDGILLIAGVKPGSMKAFCSVMLMRGSDLGWGWSPCTGTSPPAVHTSSLADHGVA